MLAETSFDDINTFEANYFSDKSLFDRLVSAESDLIDGYVNGRLTDELSERFELVYLSHPAKRERIAFAKALAARTAQDSDAATPVTSPLSLKEKLAALFGNGLSLVQFAGAFAVLVLLGAGIWYLNRNTNTEQAKVVPAPHDTPAANQAAITPSPSVTPQPMGSNTKAEPRPAEPRPSPTPAVSVPRAVTLALSTGGLRGSGSGKIPTLSILRATREVNLTFRIADNAFPDYRYSLRTAAGANVVGPTKVSAARSGSGAAFTIKVPTERLPGGDYILTLSGVGSDGSTDDISRSLFRVKKP